MTDHKLIVKTCIHCGCTETSACLGEDGKPCYWITDTCCSACHTKIEALDDSIQSKPFNPMSAIQQISIQANIFANRGHTKIFIYLEDNTVICYPTKMQRLHRSFVASYSLSVFLRGFDTKKWNELTGRLAYAQNPEVYSANRESVKVNWGELQHETS